MQVRHKIETFECIRYTVKRCFSQTDHILMGTSISKVRLKLNSDTVAESYNISHARWCHV